jgi:DNA invertase Pin-like site-specific DNA recombinase
MGNMNHPEPAVLYVRVSTEEQAKEGVSLGAQEATLRAYAALRGLEVVEVVVDAGVSGGIPLEQRPGGARLLQRLREVQRAGRRTRGPAHVLAMKLDRLFRSTADAIKVTRRWSDSGVSMHLVDMGGQTLDTSSAMGRFLLTLLAAVGEMERGLIAERTADALRHKRAQGLRTTTAAPLGYRHEGGRLVPEPRERAALEFIQVQREAGLSLRQIVAALNAEPDRFPPRGKAWHLSLVARAARVLLDLPIKAA